MGDEHNYKQKFLAAKETMQPIGPGCNDICQAMQFPPSVQNFITKLMAFFLSSKDLVTKFNVPLLCNVTSCFSSNPHQWSPILLSFRITSDRVTTLIDRYCTC